jgi:hypothetical protein
MGPWTAEIFLAHGDRGEETIVPMLIGNRLTMRPAARLEIGLTRMIQWGGTGRMNSLSSLLHVLAGSKTNVEFNVLDTDPANEIAGVDARYSCSSEHRCAFYTQLMGEDRGTILPKKIFGQFGAESWTADGRHRFFAEYSDTMCQRILATGSLENCVYRNGAYPGGYTSGGRWLGASVGPDSRLLTFGWLDADNEQIVRMHIGYVGSRVGRFQSFQLNPSPDTSGNLLGISARRRFRSGHISITPEAALTQISAPSGRHVDLRMGVSLKMPF